LLVLKGSKMRYCIFIIASIILIGCSFENPSKGPLEEALAKSNSIAKLVSEFPADSILSVRERLNAAKEDVRWLGVEASVEFVRSDAPTISKLSEASRYLKDAPQRINGLNSECGRCANQINGLLGIISSGASIDAKGDTINEEYISINAAREIEAVAKLEEVYLETERLFRLGLETDNEYWALIDSLLTAKKGIWARSIAEE